MSLIDTSYFIRDLNVPLSSNAALNSAFNNSIIRYENDILKKLLGYALWKEFTTGLEATSPLQKWLDLRDGAEFTFTFDGYTVTEKWGGFANTEKQSLIANYVYFMHRKDNETQYTGMGETKSTAENSMVVNPLNKLVQVYNSMVNWYGETPSIVRKWGTFLDLSTYEHYNTEPSAYNFLLANKATYTTWVFKPLAKVNAFGI